MKYFDFFRVITKLPESDYSNLELAIPHITPQFIKTFKVSLK